MKTTTEENDAVQTLKSLMKSLRDNANYFDEEHEYDRMNELDKVYNVLKRLVPVVEDILAEQRDVEDMKENFGEQSETVTCYALSKTNADNLIEMIDYVKDMKPFGDRSE